MASILTGLECSGARSLLGDETRPLDSMETISREVGEFIDNTSEATDTSDVETVVGCKRGGFGGSSSGNASTLRHPLDPGKEKYKGESKVENDQTKLLFENNVL